MLAQLSAFGGGARRFATSAATAAVNESVELGSAQVAGPDAFAEEVQRDVLDRLADGDLADLVEEHRQGQEDGRGVGVSMIATGTSWPVVGRKLYRAPIWAHSPGFAGTR